MLTNYGFFLISHEKQQFVRLMMQSYLNEIWYNHINPAWLGTHWQRPAESQPTLFIFSVLSTNPVISKAWKFSLKTSKSSNRSVFNFQTFVHERYDYVWKPAVGKSNESMLLRQFKQNIKSIDLQSISQWSHFLISKMLFIAGGLSDYHKITCLLPWLQISKLYILSNIW